MRFGIFGINFGPCASPEGAVRVARLAEQSGYDSVWTGEHVVLPDPQEPPSPAPPQTSMLDPAVALSFVAANTDRIRLATGIVILPQRNPLVLAKEMASVDVLSKGRLTLGVAAGYLHQEFAALGAPFAERGARTNEAIDVMRALWTQDHPTFDGRFWSFSGIDAQPRPVQKPCPPIVVGGHSAAAQRRAVERGNGWYGFALDVEATAKALAVLAAAHKDCDRPAELGDLEITITPPPKVSSDDVKRYRDLGVDRLVLLVNASTLEETCDRVSRSAELLST
jgi:probable F420-dependent oxidoreductase